MVSGIRGWLGALASLFHPPHCAACEAPLGDEGWFCPACQEGIEKRRVRPPCCHVCSEPFEGAIDSAFRCPNCADRRFRFDHAVAAYQSRGAVRDAIHQFKYNGFMHLRHPLASWLGEGLADERMRTPQIDVLVPVPLHPRRRRERGFNQAQVLASIAGKRAGLAVEALLRRRRYTTTQTHFDRRERVENLRGAFVLTRRAQVKARHLVLVDDVFTTGSTADECALTLRKAGAASVRVLCVARA